MKIYINIYLFAVLLMMLVTSCENEISYDAGELTPKLTMNAFINSDSLTHQLYLSFTGKTKPQPVTHAVVEVWVNGELKETQRPVLDEQTGLSSVNMNTRFQSGDVVRMDARTDDGKHHARVEETIPHPVQIQEIETSEVVVPPKPYYNPPRVRVKVRFNDRPGEKNYYRIVMEQRETLRGASLYGEEQTAQLLSYSYWPWDDIALTDGRPATSEELETELFERVTNIYGVFDDSWFRDKAYELNVQVVLREWQMFSSEYYKELLGFSPRTMDVDVAVRLLSITEAEYYYLNTLNIIDSDIMEEYISDPIKIPSNVYGGNGFVGFSSENSQVIRLIENKEIEYSTH